VRTSDRLGDAQPDWQQRLERSRFGRGLLSMLIGLTLVAIVAINLPASDLRTQLLRPGQPYANALGVDQNWALFAPDPRRVLLEVHAVIAYEDGQVSTWTFPHDGALLGTYRDYRWRKWVENLIAPVNGRALLVSAAQWAASQSGRAGHTVTRVTLVERYARLLPPGSSPEVGPAADRVLITLRPRAAG
jgi:hypothetical protein